MAPGIPPYYPLPSFSSPWAFQRKQSLDSLTQHQKPSTSFKTGRPESRHQNEALLFANPLKMGPLFPTSGNSTRSSIHPNDWNSLRDANFRNDTRSASLGWDPSRSFDQPMKDSSSHLTGTFDHSLAQASEAYRTQMRTQSVTGPPQLLPGWDVYTSSGLPISYQPLLPQFFPYPGRNESPNKLMLPHILPQDWNLPGHSGERSSVLTHNDEHSLQLEKAIADMSLGSNLNHQSLNLIEDCAMCELRPKLMLFPCQHRICYGCGGRFMTAGGEGMYCGCGELVSSMINLDTHRQPSGTLVSTPYPPSMLPLPESIIVREDTRRIRTKPPGFDHVEPKEVVVAATQSSTPIISLDTSMTLPSGAQELLMDAETAIENAPFVELGRHALAQNWSCVKVSNIPYNVTTDQILEFIGKNAKIVPEDVGLPIHIIMDRATGKTMDAFIEFTCPKDAYRCVVRKRTKILGARHVGLDVVGQTELMKEVFPRARGVKWEGVIPGPVEGEDGFKRPEIVTKEELVLVVGHARTPHRSPFSRKCLQRPYESILSIVAKFPWFAVNMYTIQHRDIIFQALLSSINILKRQCKRGRTTPNLDVELLKKLCKIGAVCTGFTNSQKRDIIQTGEFGAEGLGGDIAEDVKGYEHLNALVTKPGAESKIVEMYTLLSTLGSEQISYERCLASTTSEQTPNTDINLASSSPSAASHSLEITAKQLEQDTPNICLPNDSSGSEDISRLTMAETAEQEWKFIERVVKAILPPRVRRVDALSPVPASPIPPARNEERPDERKQDRSTCTRKLGASAQ